MNLTNIEDKSKKHSIASLLMEAKHAYYNGYPVMEDAQFDALEEKLREADPSHPYFSVVGAKIDPTKEVVRHLFPMGSQNKVNTIEELFDWTSKSVVDGGLIHVSHKVDGMSMALYYEGGVLVKAVTRGDGIQGEDVTHNAMFFKAPKFLSEPITCQIRGECFLTIEAWEALDPKKDSNPRNVVAGIINRKDAKDAKHVRFAAFDIRGDDGFPTVTEKMEFLRTLGFTPVVGVTATKTNIVEVIEHFTKTRDGIGFWIDGLVIQGNDLNNQDRLGMNHGFKPKGQVAWKFTNEATTTTLVEVIWQIGATGRVTPVGILDPVRLGGTTVTRVMLNNASFIRALGLCIGATVEVEKANDIIPMITGVVNTNGGPEVPVPDWCPACSRKLVRANKVEGEGLDLMCENADCDGKAGMKLKRAFDTFNILGVGRGFVPVIMDRCPMFSGFVKFILSPEAVSEMSGWPVSAGSNTRFGTSRAEALKSEVTKAVGTEQRLDKFLKSLGARHLGERAVEIMSKKNPVLGKVSWWKKLAEETDQDKGSYFTDLCNGGVSANSMEIINAISGNQELLDLLDLFKIRGFDEAGPPVNASGNSDEASTDLVATKGKVCITGILPSGKRKAEYAAPLLAAGYELVDDITKDCTYLVQADPSSQSSKSKKAQKLGITILSEDGLIGLIPA